ncbi:MAG: hypothetical protein ACKOJB_14365, partial [Chthoniobacterales bacterium]
MNLPASLPVPGRFASRMASVRPGFRAALMLLVSAFLCLAASLRAQVPLDPFIANNATYYVTNATNYILTNDVEWSSTNTNATTPIEIVVSGVTLDLNGKTIRAINSATSAGNLAGIRIVPGLFSLSISNVKITNGVIRGFRENGISVFSGTGILLAGLTIADIHNSTTNAPNFFADLLNPTAGISIELGLGGVTVSNVVISNVSGGPNVMSVAGLEAL